MDRVRVGRKMLRIGDLIESTKGIAQVVSIEKVTAPLEDVISRSLTKVHTNCKTVLLKDIKIIYMRNKEQGFDRYDVGGQTNAKHILPNL